MKVTFPIKDGIQVKDDTQVKDRRCAHCNARLPSYAKFCGNCGEMLDKSAKARPIGSLLTDGAGIVLPLCALVLWSLSLSSVNVRLMNDLGLVSVLPASIIIALIILTLSFCFALNQQRARVSILLFHVLILIVMLYSITTLVEEAPRFAVVYRHAGYTEFIMRTGTVDPNLDAYFSWPGFFILSAFLTKIAGYHDILSYAAWAPVFFNLIYLGPLYVILTTATRDKRIIWLAIWFFYVTNWIGQDYFSPQGLNFFMYLVIIAILLKWFKRSTSIPPDQQTRQWRRLGRLSPFLQRLYEWLRAPDMLVTPIQPLKRKALLVTIIVIFAFSVFSHPLTPFFIIASVAALAIFNRCTPRWLPILMAAITVTWAITMAQAYLVGHLADVIGGVGQFRSAISDNVTSRVLDGDPQHTFIANLRLVMTFFIWGLAFLGCVRRLRGGYQDATYVLLAIAPFPVILVQSYGGEMLMRIYMFTLPAMAFFAAALFYSTPIHSKSLTKKVDYQTASITQEESSKPVKSSLQWMKIALGAVSIVLLVGFLFTRYGNERMDYITNAELASVSHLYNIAPKGSLLISAWEGTPWEFQNYEQYNQSILIEDLPKAVLTSNTSMIVQFIDNIKPPKAYLIITRSQRASAQATGAPPGILDQLEHALLKSGKFVKVYSNSDSEIFQFTGGKGGGSS
ncbi:MAG: zinc ribbon domain-containing protein [Ktedonobacteraceae bacterium]